MVYQRWMIYSVVYQRCLPKFWQGLRNKIRPCLMRIIQFKLTFVKRIYSNIYHRLILVNDSCWKFLLLRERDLLVMYNGITIDFFFFPPSSMKYRVFSHIIARRRKGKEQTIHRSHSFYTPIVDKCNN
jgi:hypothetical protein